LDKTEDRQIKVCCATFYESDAIRMLIGESFHPGGLALTHRLGEVMGLNAECSVLDVACGRGTSAVYLARKFGCTINGIDYSKENIAAAQAHAAEKGVAGLTMFKQGDAERLPFDDTIFDAVVTECSFCTFPNKELAAGEMARVSRIGGSIGLTDMTISGSLPEDIQSMLTWVACITGAGTSQEYVSILEKYGFVDFTIEDHSDKLINMVNGVRKKLFGIDMMAGLGKLDLGVLDLDEGKRLAQRSVELIESGEVGYTLITGIRG
jgi:arsenite methyltransferase